MADALALPPKLLQQFGIFGSIQLFKLHANPFCQRRAVPSGRDGDLQRATTDDGRGDEVAGVRRIDDVHPDVVFARCLAHGPIHLWLIGGTDDQHAAQYIGCAKRSRLMRNDALCREGGQGFGEFGADNEDLGICLKQPIHFTGRNLPAANHQATFALQIHEHWIIAWHVLVLDYILSLRRSLPLPEGEGTVGLCPGRKHLPLSISFSAQAHVVGVRRSQRDSKSR
jgi:hypothetical protein